MKSQAILNTGQSKFEAFIVKAILLSGILLSLWQFLHNRSLWLDEAALALNIINKDFTELLYPLDYQQAAPILFLFIEKAFSSLIPGTEYGLRLFPLLSYWASLYFFYLILRLVFRNPLPVILALSLFVFNPRLIYYASEVKQYMPDVLVSTALIYFLLKEYKQPANRYITLGALGFLSVFLSNVAPLILAGCGFYLLGEYYSRKRYDWIHFGILSAVWLAGSGIYFYFFIHDHPLRNFMLEYWSKSSAFLPLHPFSPEFFQFISTKSDVLSISILQVNLVEYQFPILIMLGILSAITRKKALLTIILIFPVFLHLLLSALKLYPFDNRFVLYLYPLFIIVMVLLFDHLLYLSTSLLKIHRMAPLAILLPIPFIFLFFYTGFPQKKQEIKESLRYIEQHIKDDEKIVVYGSAWHAYAYYRDIKYVDFSGNPVRRGSYQYERDAFFDKIMKENEQVWILMSHVKREEREYVIEQLTLMGMRVIDSMETRGSRAILLGFNHP